MEKRMGHETAKGSYGSLQGLYCKGMLNLNRILGV